MTKALGRVGDPRLVAKLGRPARATHPDRARVGIDQRNTSIRNRPLTSETEVGLRKDLLGCFELALKLLNQRDADTLAARVPARPARQRARLAHRLLGPLGDLRGQ